MDFCYEDCFRMPELDIFATETMFNFFDELVPVAPNSPEVVDIASSSMSSASSPEVVTTMTEEKIPIVSKEVVDKTTVPPSSAEALKEAAKKCRLTSVRRANVKKSKRKGLESKKSKRKGLESKKSKRKGLESKKSKRKGLESKKSKRKGLESTALSSHKQCNLNDVERKKAIHKEDERKRREAEKNSLQNLRISIPNTKNKIHASRVTITNEAFKYIHELKTLLAESNALQSEKKKKD